MNEKRKYPRYPCQIKGDFEYYEGNPEEIDTEAAISIKGKGFILDISKGGLFIVSNSRVGINQPIKIKFSRGGEDYNPEGTIVRTGLLKNNPSEVAKKFAKKKVKGDSYIAVEFNEPLEGFIEKDL